jgi:hypothetical protein
MSDILSSGLTGGMNGLAGGGGQAVGRQAQQSGGQSFENVLQQGGQNSLSQNSGGAESMLGAPTQISGAQLERMRLDLVQRLDRLPEGAGKTSALLPELIDSRTRLGLLREAVSGVSGNGSGVGTTDLRGKLMQVETEWKQLDGIMRSDKNLSTGELLGLQARLYQVSQHIEVMSKVVDQVTGGIKTILNTNI